MVQRICRHGFVFQIIQVWRLLEKRGSVRGGYFVISTPPCPTTWIKTQSLSFPSRPCQNKTIAGISPPWPWKSTRKILCLAEMKILRTFVANNFSGQRWRRQRQRPRVGNVCEIYKDQSRRNPSHLLCKKIPPFELSQLSKWPYHPSLSSDISMRLADFDVEFGPLH